ncbi:hypothetical protein QM012_009509 [Aureobasidium pullulans]|uniref:BTB domain-containing protein n=1 Tax=Aureobasidium pullulans TaxID=5580 RepID=A0ABR0TH17_AURPU
MDNSDIVETTRVTEFEGEEWPCFVFPDHQVPPGMIEPRPNKYALPVMLLEREQFEWRSRDALNDFDPCATRTFDGTRAGREREQAFNEAVEYHGMDYYHNLAWNKQAAQEMANAIVLDDDDDDDDDDHFKTSKHNSLQRDSKDEVTITSITKKKRPYSSAFKRSGPPTPSPTPRKRRKPAKKVPASLPFGEDDSDVDLPHPSTFTPTRKSAPKSAASEWKPGGSLHIPDPTDYVLNKQLELLRTKNEDGKPPSPEKPKVLEPVKDPLKVNVYVGDEEKLFILDRILIQNYPSFMKHITGDNKNGFEIRNKVFRNLNSTAFESIMTWFNTADYGPRLIEGDHPHLEGVKSTAQFEEAADAASALWNLAHRLELTELQELIYRKIEVQTPLAANSLLMMTRMVFWNSPTDTKIDGKMRRMLRMDVAARLHEILEEEPYLLNRVIKGDVELANYIWQYRIDHPWEEPAEHLSEDDGDEAGDDDE